MTTIGAESATPATGPREAVATPELARLIEKIDQRTATIGVVGLGYVGLPLARAFIDAGFSVLGFDVDADKVAALERGASYIGHIPDGWISQWQEREVFSATVEFGRLREADAILVCVPTPLTSTREPDLRYVTSTADQIAASLRPGQLIVLESTTYPSTSRDVVAPRLRRSGHEIGRDIYLAYSPEREDPGNPSYTASGIPKVVGGYDDDSRRAAVALYDKAMQSVVPVSSCEVAEACKILENTYRAVNIALVNEMKVLCDRMGIDVWEVIEAAKTKPFGFSAFYPGPGLGGHCIPIDPFYLSWIARKHGMSTRFIELAGEVNSAMPDYVVSRLTAALNDRAKPVRGSRIAVLGVAYKRDVDDPRESPSFHLMERLRALGANVTYNDPHVPRLPQMRHHDLPELCSTELTEAYLASQDAVLIATDHSSYDFAFIVRHANLVVDTRNATRCVPGREDRVVLA